ncbi:two component sensor histidine kinase NtrB [Gluconacetobacter johannae DSM 13595]|uniref:histidine kinase n=1 Tax=Gluconacetobacter johannae TaxID=112140 RepID=A0A7W4J4L7_9PROT|nr:ATP-binding protein [Gluconacetobacter johannae]MBB2174353.1 PAS domain-containing protein [Gluconacetobacter johannae]GBQ85187.1 two component sensor histidine kinase NtrB [Gluconacetobacter johannae DSM 13595]
MVLHRDDDTPAPASPAGTPDGVALLDALPMPVVLVGPGHRIRYVNSAAEPFFGVSSPHLVQMRLTDLLAGDHPVFLLVEQVLRDGVTIAEHELMLEGPRLRRTGITVQGTLVTEEPESVLLTFHDSSAARTLDRQLTFRSAARSVSGMAAILAHEVKNPLSGIRGAAQLLESSVGENDRELAVLIRDEADRIRDLVERMEIFSDKPIERRPVNIHRVLERVRLLAQQGFAANIRIVEEYDPSLPPVWGNRDQLVQVLLNLLKNAAEAIESEGEGGTITLGTSYRHGVRLAVPGMEQRVELPLVVSVRDSGPGIPDSIRPHLFEPFLTTKASGSGLGLALAGKIIGDHGGVIEIDSQPGRTEVLLHLPVVAEGKDTT